MKDQIVELSEDNFDEMFKPQINHIERAKADPSIADEDICSFSGTMYETYGEDLEYVMEMGKLNRVVTIVDGESDSEDDDAEPKPSVLYYLSGAHFVNRLGYLVLDKPYTFDFEVKLEW